MQVERANDGLRSCLNFRIRDGSPRSATITTRGAGRSFAKPGTLPSVSYCTYTRAVQWKTGKVVLKIACKADVIVCRV